ncbi:MAG TPA: dihydrofolate reductase family protein [Actinomycetota bacterium]|nr:dihydrofolate reductase family protein [Actinomycetota bacterium]
MRKIVAGLFVSLDGVTESPEGWTFPYFDDEVGQAIGAQMASSDAMLLGRRTYEEFARYWPEADAPFAGYMNETPKYVASTSLTSVEWRGSTLLRGDVAGAVAALKREPGKDISIPGSVTLVRTLLGVGLVDQLRLLLYPIVVGRGKRLFEGPSDQVPMKLLDSRTFGTGVVSLTYEPPAVGKGVS